MSTPDTAHAVWMRSAFPDKKIIEVAELDDGTRAIRDADRPTEIVFLTPEEWESAAVIRDHWDDVRALWGPSPLLTPEARAEYEQRRRSSRQSPGGGVQ